jgi:hypothetical protein
MNVKISEKDFLFVLMVVAVVIALILFAWCFFGSIDELFPPTDFRHLSR